MNGAGTGLAKRVAAAVGLLGVVLLLGTCVRQSRPQQVGPVAADVPDVRGTIFALLADGRLLALQGHTGTIVQQRLSTASIPLTGHYLALSNDRSRLFVLTPDNRVAVLDTGTAELRGSHRPAARGSIFRSLAVGPITGRLYLFGNRGGRVVVMVLDPDTGTVLADWTARGRDGRDWLVYQGAVADDERDLFVSYHGRDTTGIDRFTLVGDGLQRCPGGQRPNFGCLGAHGGFLPSGDHLLVATGDGAAILALGLDGAIVRGYDPRLSGNHLMEFAVDRHAERLYAVGSCGYSGGVSVIDLRAGGSGTETRTGWQWLSAPAPPLTLIPPEPPGTIEKTVPCGERLALAPDGVLVVGRTAKPVPDDGAQGALLFLDGNTGRVLDTVVTPAEPVDVLVVQAP